MSIFFFKLCLLLSVATFIKTDPIISDSGPITLAYKVYEPEVKNDLPDILIIHGIIAHKEHFDIIGDKLAQGSQRKVYAVDLRNHGDSEWTEEFSFPIMVQDIHMFMDEHDIKKAVFLGHSLGGRLAMIFALAHAEKVDKLIVEDISPKMLDLTIIHTIEMLIQLMKNSVNEIPPDVDAETAKDIFMEKLLEKIPKAILKRFPTVRDNLSLLKLQVVQKNGNYTLKTNLPVLLKTGEGLKFDTNLDGKYEGPSFFIYGNTSNFKVGNDKEFILERFPLAKFHGIDNADHNVHHDNPEEFLEEILKFLKNN